MKVAERFTQLSKQHAHTGIHVTSDELIQLRLPAERLKLPGQQRSSAQQSGPQHSRFRGRGMDYQESRGYQPGDDIRSMDWRVTARTGRPHTKIFQEERERPVLLIIDYSPSMDFGSQQALKRVVAARLATLLAWTAVRHNDRVGVFLFGGFGQHELAPRSGRNSVLALIKQLVDQQSISPNADYSGTDNACTLADILHSVRRVARPGSLIIVLSDFYQLDEDTKRHLLFIRRHNDLIACHIFDPLELSPPPAGRYGISDGRQLQFLDTRSKAVCQHYQELATQRQQDLAETCQRLAIPLISLSTATDLLPQWQQGLRI